MTPERAKQLLQGQSGLAQKVFGAIPIMEAWSLAQIKAELERTGKVGSITHPQLLGCLRDLSDAGLVGEPQREWFRSRVKLPAETPAPKEIEKPMPPVAEKPMPVPAAPQPNVLDRLAGLANELGDIADHLRHRLARVNKIAQELEDVALAITQERENSEAGMAKLKQLQSILRDLSPA